jgi:hypothetical protein
MLKIWCLCKIETFILFSHMQIIATCTFFHFTTKMHRNTSDHNNRTSYNWRPWPKSCARDVLVMISWFRTPLGWIHLMAHHSETVHVYCLILGSALKQLMDGH